MQTIDSNLLTAMKRGYQVEGRPLCIAEWNFNYTYATTVTNELDTDNIAWVYTKDYFPPSSVTNGVRPNSGIFYPSIEEAELTSEISGVGTQRFYPLSKNNVYQYWESPVFSDQFTAGEDTIHIQNAQYAIDKSKLRVDYAGSIKTNKIRVTFNLGPVPLDWVISIQDAATDVWSDIAGPYTIDPVTGKCEIWWNGTAWTSTQALSSSVYKTIKAVKVWIKKIDTAMARVKIVEIAACREVNMTSRMVDYSLNSSMDNQDFIHPVGDINSNDGSVSIDNSDLAMSEIDTSSDFYGLLSGWSMWRFYVDFDMTRYGGASSVPVRVGTMYTNNWAQTDQYMYEIELFDIVKILQSIKCPVMFEENTTIAKIISSMLDSVGIDLYNFEPEDFDTSHAIRYFWTDGTETIYEVLNKICSEYQSAVFTDEFGSIRLLTREDLLDEDDDSLWTFLGAPDGLDIPDVASLKKKSELMVNDVNIKYKRRRAKVDDLDVQSRKLTTEVWSSTDSIVLRAAAIRVDIPESGLTYVSPITTQTVNASICIKSEEAEKWPWQGFANIDGEVFKWEGKGYIVWDYTLNKPDEKIVKSQEEKMKWDKTALDRYEASGQSKLIANYFSGRLIVTERNTNGIGERAHSMDIAPGWFGMNVWSQEGRNPTFWPGKYIEPGRTTQSDEEELQDFKTRNGWSSTQNKWSWNGSVLTCDNISEGQADRFLKASIVKNLGDTEYREFGTRIKLHSGSPYAMAGILFCFSDAVGYSNTDFLDNIMDAHRFYVVNITATDAIESIGRPHHEITAEVKLGDPIVMLDSQYRDNTHELGPGRKWQIDRDRWYDLDVILKDGRGTGIVGNPPPNFITIEVYLDGQFIDSFKTEEAIRPTGWVGLHAKYASKASFDYFYACTTSDTGRPNYYDDEDFDTSIIQLPAGTNVVKEIAIPIDGGVLGDGVFSIASSADIQVHSMQVLGSKTNALDAWTNTFKVELGPRVIKAFNRSIVTINDVLKQDAGAIHLKYTCTDGVSVCLEYSKAINFPYASKAYIPPPRSFYDVAKAGYVSSKPEAIMLDQRIYNYWDTHVDTDVLPKAQLFYDDFGAIAREIRPFELKYDVSPAKGVRLFSSNPKVRVVEENFGLTKANFTLVNAGIEDEIVSGTEELDADNSIDHTLFLYGHVLEDKGDQVKNIQNKDSIRKYGMLSTDLDSEWIFTDEQAEALGEWIANNWGEPMDVLELEVFSNTFSQIGDKVNIKYPDTSIDEDWIYVISQISRSFGDDGFSSRVTVRRVR